MRRTWMARVLMCAAMLMVVGAGPARAEGFLSPFIGYNFGGDSVCPTARDCDSRQPNLGVAFGTLGSVVGFEEEIGYARDFFPDAQAAGGASSVLTVMSNFLVAPKIGIVRPYVLVGVGLMKSRVELTPSSLVSASHNDLGWDLGGGLMVHLAPHVGVRGDLRYFHAFQDLEIAGVTLSDAKLDFGRLSGAFVLTF